MDLYQFFLWRSFDSKDYNHLKLPQRIPLHCIFEGKSSYTTTSFYNSLDFPLQSNSNGSRILVIPTFFLSRVLKPSAYLKPNLDVHDDRFLEKLLQPYNKKNKILHARGKLATNLEFLDSQKFHIIFERLECSEIIST